MEKTFTFTVRRYLDGSWYCIRQCYALDVNQKRKLVRLAKRLGYIYSSVHRAYILKNSDGVLKSIARFQKEN